MKVIYDECCPVDTAYLINNDFMAIAIQMSKRVWWKPWTWKRHQLSVSEMWGLK